MYAYDDQKSQRNNRSRRRSISIAVLFTLIYANVTDPAFSKLPEQKTSTVPESPEDAPVTITTVGVWVASTVGSAVVAWFVGKGLDSHLARKPPKKRTTRTRTVQVRKPDGTVIKQRETVTVDPPLTDVNPMVSIVYPSDWVPAPFLLGDKTLGTTVGLIDVVNETVSNTSDGLIVGTAIPGVLRQFGGTLVQDDWIMTETVDSHFRRPTDPGAMGANFSWSPRGTITLSTTDLPNTTATVGFGFTVDVPQLGGIIWDGGVEIDQGANTFRVLGDGIPGAIFTVVGPGVLQVDYDGMLTRSISDSVDFLDLSVDTRYFGKATLGRPIPAVSEWAAIGMALLLLAAGTIVLFRKRETKTGAA